MLENYSKVSPVLATRSTVLGVTPNPGINLQLMYSDQLLSMLVQNFNMAATGRTVPRVDTYTHTYTNGRRVVPRLSGSRKADIRAIASGVE